MSSVTWVSTSGDWSSNASWSTGAVPVSTDDVFFIDNGAVSVSSGLAQGAVDLNSLNVIDFTGNIGASGSPLVIGATYFRIGGSGENYIQNDLTGTEKVWVYSHNRAAALSLTGNACARVVVLRGAVTIGAAVTLLQVGYIDNEAADADVTISGVAISNVHQSGGRIRTTGGATVSTLYRAGGTFEFAGAAGGSLSLINGGGIFKYQATNLLAPQNISVLISGNGTVDLSEPYSVYEVVDSYIMGRANYLKHPSVTTSGSEYNVNTEVAQGPQL